MPAPLLSPGELKARRAAIDAVLHNVNAQIAALPGPVLRDLAPALAAAQSETQKAFARILATAKGDETFSAQMYRNALVQLRGAFAAVEKLDPVLGAALTHSVTPTAQLAKKSLEYELAAFSKIFEDTIRTIPIDLAAVLSTQGKPLMERYRTSAARYAGNVGKDIRRQLQIGYLRGETVDQLTRRLIAQGGPKGRVALAGVLGEPAARVEFIADGLFKRYNYWAERLVRTETIHGYNTLADESISQAAQLEPDLRRRWDASLDSRICPICKELDHTIVKVGQAFPGGIDYPPAHPNCRCAICAWMKDWDETRRKPKRLDNPAPAGGPAPALIGAAGLIFPNNP